MQTEDGEFYDVVVIGGALSGAATAFKVRSRLDGVVRRWIT
jgi:flavin-dependent dehydrogenase